MGVATIFYYIVIAIVILRVVFRVSQKARKDDSINEENPKITGAYSELKPVQKIPFLGNMKLSSDANNTQSNIEKDNASTLNTNVTKIYTNSLKKDSVTDVVKNNSVTEEQGSQSTVDFLRDKADKGKASQIIDDRKNAAINSKFRGNSRSAERLLLGDTVPLDKQSIICGYCGAENIIPKHPTEQYNCYFCREIL